MRDVLAFTRFTESITFNGLGENNSRRSRVINCRPVRGMHLDRIMTAEPHAGELLVRQMLHHLQQPGIGAKKVLPKASPTLDKIFLILAVGDLAHPPQEQTIAIGLNELIPIAAPDNLDDVPSGSTENCF